MKGFHGHAEQIGGVRSKTSTPSDKWTCSVVSPMELDRQMGLATARLGCRPSQWRNLRGLVFQALELA
jgi:hypothetical protein